MNFPPKSHLFLTITIQLQDDTTIAAPVFEWFPNCADSSNDKNL
jgi:hypothetical protein